MNGLDFPNGTTGTGSREVCRNLVIGFGFIVNARLASTHSFVIRKQPALIGALIMSVSWGHPFLSLPEFFNGYLVSHL